MTYVISDECVDVMDKSCVRECPVDCIYEGERSMYIHPDECIDCGACEATCPVNAIIFDIDLEDDQQHLLERAREVFVEVGSPGSARQHGPLGKDHAAVAALPPKTADAP
jgi:NAD-dependent dihydropyrimidine dehydrogenase PreA subunit